VQRTNGGGCVNNTATAGTAGSAYVGLSTQITIVYAAQLGTDGVPCTADDTPTVPGTPSVIGLTTGTASAQVFDADATPGAAIPSGLTCPAALTGAALDCTLVESSIMAGGRLNGAFSSLHALYGPPRVDSKTTFTLECL